MNEIREHYKQFALNYDKEIRRIVPEYDKMLDSIVSSLEFKKSGNLSILDIGCGTGNLVYQIKKDHPSARIHCIDLTGDMVKAAKMKLSEFASVSFDVVDMNDFEFNNKFDAIVSSLTFQNFPSDESKVYFYTKCFDALNEGGYFLIGGIGLGETEKEQEKFMRNWKNFMAENSSAEKAMDIVEKYKQKDHPSRFVDEIKWLNEIGLRNVRVFWQKWNFAVWGGRK